MVVVTALYGRIVPNGDPRRFSEWLIRVCGRSRQTSAGHAQSVAPSTEEISQSFTKAPGTLLLPAITCNKLDEISSILALFSISTISNGWFLQNFKVQHYQLQHPSANTVAFHCNVNRNIRFIYVGVKECFNPCPVWVLEHFTYVDRFWSFMQLKQWDLQPSSQE